MQQVGNQKLGNGFAQKSYLGTSYRVDAIYNYSQVPRQHIKSVSPMTFSQKLYQSPALPPQAEETTDQKYEQALTEAKSLERINILLSEIVSYIR